MDSLVVFDPNRRSDIYLKHKADCQWLPLTFDRAGRLRLVDLEKLRCEVF